MIDEGIAKDLREKVDALHKAIHTAGKAGLFVDITVNNYDVSFTDFKWPFVDLKVSKPL